MTFKAGERKLSPALFFGGGIWLTIVADRSADQTRHFISVRPLS